MSDRDYQVHVVPARIYAAIKVGHGYAGGVVINGIYCDITGRNLIITYHGPEGCALPVRKPRVPELREGGFDVA